MIGCSIAQNHFLARVKSQQFCFCGSELPKTGSKVRAQVLDMGAELEQKEMKKKGANGCFGSP